VTVVGKQNRASAPSRAIMAVALFLFALALIAAHARMLEQVTILVLLVVYILVRSKFALGSSATKNKK
jgi:hypothetical protein